MNNDLNARLTQLEEQFETRLAFQDDTIEQLNQEITNQGAQTARLQAQLSLMAQRFKELHPPMRQAKSTKHRRIINEEQRLAPSPS